mmetsp:Transcript_14836/g.23536  ORF Transcript_14836/g.23536 Transcript_14836/m.23536 type:complete len:363 (+) Transcript_14836:153-1241(+)
MGRCSEAPIVMAVAAAALMLLIFTLTTLTLQRYNPIYTPVECVNANNSFTWTETPHGAVNVSAHAVLQCRNPNPYSLRIEPAVQGANARVALSYALIDDSSLSLEPVQLSAHSTAETRVSVDFSVPQEQLPLLLNGPVDVYQEMKLRITAMLEFPGGWAVQQHLEQRSDCGFKLQVQPEALIGQTMCAPSLGDLIRTLPSMNGTAIFQLEIPTRQLAEAVAIRDSICTSVMSLSLGFFICLSVCAWLRIHRRCLGRPQPPRSTVSSRKSPDLEDPEKGIPDSEMRPGFGRGQNVTCESPPVLSTARSSTARGSGESPPSTIPRDTSVPSSESTKEGGGEGGEGDLALTAVMPSKEATGSMSL